MARPHRISIVEHFTSPVGTDSVGAARACGGEYIDPTQGRQLHHETAREPTGAMDEQRFSAVEGQRLGDHLFGGQRRTAKIAAVSHETLGGLWASAPTGAIRSGAQAPWSRSGTG